MWGVTRSRGVLVIMSPSTLFLPVMSVCTESVGHVRAREVRGNSRFVFDPWDTLSSDFSEGWALQMYRSLKNLLFSFPPQKQEKKIDSNYPLVRSTYLMSGILGSSSRSRSNAILSRGVISASRELGLSKCIILRKLVQSLW